MLTRNVRSSVLRGVRFALLTTVLCVSLFFLVMILDYTRNFSPPQVSVSAACRDIPDTRSAPMRYLSDVLGIEGDIDEFGKASRFVRPVSVVRKLLADGLLPANPQNQSSHGANTPRHRSQEEEESMRSGRPLYAVNFGARDGRGDEGNTDPVYPIIAELGFHGLAVEASPAVFPQLNLTMTEFPVWAVNSFITVDNAVPLIQEAELPEVDVFKIDIDSNDCDVTPRVLEAYRPPIVIAEYNVYFPPPIKMKLLPSPLGYDSNKRSNVYECSITYLDEEVMRPLGYVLLQLSWENVIYARQDIAAGLGMKEGVDVQAAYHRGYTMQPRRGTLFPWGDWEDVEGGKPRVHGLDHLLNISTHEERAAAALRWANVSLHRQEEGAIFGCGNRYTTLRWPATIQRAA